ncbi:sensor histidine kinase [Sunxiuqinia sp. A32]|uniref:sensor histidine kinase n=1 Tax=Sunxiuqinia sp. A32 TaxID=3461496 RepID=UPI004045EEE7
MELYSKKRRWKIILLLSAILIGGASLSYTNWLVQKMSVEERKNVSIWAEATKRMAKPELNANENMSFLLNIIEQNTSIPIIVADKYDSIKVEKNIEYPVKRKKQVLANELKKMKEHEAPIEIKLSEEESHYLYYRESSLLRNLRLFPIVQFAVIMLFITVSYLAFSASRKAEQNQVWVGMSKETAHQLGTPISSLMAWIELLKMQDVKEEMITEFEKDINRLEKVTERFSKIGSAPELVTDDLRDVIKSSVSYLESRSPKKIKFVLDFGQDHHYFAPHNVALFSWVIENLCKNAIDAIENEGVIGLHLSEKNGNIVLDISDNGKGIHKSLQKNIFRPGFTTKKRGWGLGLSLSKRIVENYHNGKIFIKQSELGRGTTFRIIIPKA